MAGGVGAELTGGEFWKGATTGAIVAGLNHLAHRGLDGDDEDKRNPKQDKPLTKGQIKSLQKKQGWSHREKGDGGGKRDYYSDKQGNVYEKPKGGSGPGEPVGYNVKNLYTATSLVIGGIVAYEVIKWGGAIILATPTGGLSLVGAVIIP